MKAINLPDDSAPFTLRYRALATTLSLAVIVCVLKFSPGVAAALAGAALGSAMLTTALIAQRPPDPQAHPVKRGIHLLTFGLSAAMESIDEMSRSARLP